MSVKFCSIPLFFTLVNITSTNAEIKMQTQLYTSKLFQIWLEIYFLE